ncbi:hypothetical protein [Wolbachia endosymbiont (group A) of Oxytorus armatus]|uniref:hypothetical protein n=1 Tax=Wolbachia endosymbiont (group A) of Oxytorus armatus TaxID=3066211 RepID=UPI003133419F
MIGTQVKSSKPPKLPTQVIYDAFIQLLKNKVQPKELKEDDEAVLAFMLSQNQTIFNNVKLEDVEPLSEENFSQFLLSVFKEIREQGLAREEKLNDDKIRQIITKCVADIRGTEAKDSSIKFVLEMPLLLIGGIKIDPKNISGSFMDGVKEKIPFLGKDKKEEDEPPLSDEEMVKAFLRKSLFPITLFAFSALIFGTGPIALAISGGLLVWTEVSTIKSLFSNNKKGTLYDPSSQDKDDTEKRAKLNKKICDGINKILGTPVEKAKGSEQPISVSEQISQGKEKSEQQPVPEQISQENNRENEESKQQDQPWTRKENERKEENTSNKQAGIT